MWRARVLLSRNLRRGRDQLAELRIERDQALDIGQATPSAIGQTVSAMMATSNSSFTWPWRRIHSSPLLRSMM
jgi:hypothetical protein